MICRMLLTVVCLLAVACSNDEEGQVQAQTTMKAGRTLVVSYSYTGNCRDIVTTLTSQIEADVLEIEPAEKGLKYEANGYALGTELLNAIKANPNDASSYPAIDPVSTSLADYQNIIIVTPLWWSQMAAIMQAYLFSAGPEMVGKNIGLIVSSASSGISGVVADCKRLVPDGNYFSENLWINNSNRSRRSTLIKDWLSAINFQEATGVGQIENGETRTGNAPVYDLSGRKIVNRKSVNRQFSNLPKGIYIANGRKLLQK